MEQCLLIINGITIIGTQKIYDAYHPVWGDKRKFELAQNGTYGTEL